MAYQPTPTKVEAGKTKARTADDNTQQLLEKILIALNQVNMQLALMTSTEFNEDEQL